MGPKVRAKKTVADIRKLKTFIEESNADGSLKGKINRTARMEDKFGSWLTEFNNKNRNYPEVMDLTRFANPELDLKKDSSLRKDEIEMLHEFQKRKFDRIASESHENIPEEFTQSPTFIPSEFQNAEFFTRDRFLTIVLARATSTKVTTLNRINRCKYLLFTGNLEGVIGYGIGKGIDWEVAMEKAIHDLKKNLITIDLDYHYSWTDSQMVKYGRTHLTIEPDKEFRSWGDPVLGTMLHLSGIHHCHFRQWSRNFNPWTRLYAFMKAVTNNRTPKIIAETEGKKLFETGLSRRPVTYRESDMFMR